MKEAPATKASPIKGPAQTCKTTVSKPGILLFIPKHFTHPPCTGQETQAQGGDVWLTPQNWERRPHTPPDPVHEPCSSPGLSPCCLPTALLFTLCINRPQPHGKKYGLGVGW